MVPRFPLETMPLRAPALLLLGNRTQDRGVLRQKPLSGSIDFAFASVSVKSTESK